MRFRQSPDLYYLTGLEEPGLVLVLNGVTKHAAVFALKRPKFGAPDPTPDLRDVPQPVETYGLPVQPMENFFTFLTFAAGIRRCRSSTCSSRRPTISSTRAAKPGPPTPSRWTTRYSATQPPASQAIERIHSAVPHLALADVSPKLDELRWVKTAYEVARLRRAGDIGAAAVAEAIRAPARACTSTRWPRRPST